MSALGARLGRRARCWLLTLRSVSIALSLGSVGAVTALGEGLVEISLTARLLLMVDEELRGVRERWGRGSAGEGRVL